MGLADSLQRHSTKLKWDDSKVRKLVSVLEYSGLHVHTGGKGTGLGLALVRQIVKLSGGRLGVQSKVNEGSTFWVELRECLGSYTGNNSTDTCIG